MTMKKRRTVAKQRERAQRAPAGGVARKSAWRQTDRRRALEPRLAPPRRAERQHARPGAGIKRSRNAMARRP
jgi:hypothetical protein